MKGGGEEREGGNTRREIVKRGEGERGGRERGGIGERYRRGGEGEREGGI